MDVTRYVETVQAGVQSAAALGDDHTRQVAERLGVSVASASRLALLEALADAAAEISVELAPGSVELRMSGTEPVFVVTSPPAEHADAVTVLQPEENAPSVEAGDPDDQQARVSLRLPQSVKEKVDEYADAEGVSTNTWLLHRVLEALAERTRRSGGRTMAWGINIGTDGVRLNVPSSAPAPPAPPRSRGAFPAAEHDPDRDDPGRRQDQGRRGRPDRGSGPVQGWVR